LFQWYVVIEFRHQAVTPIVPYVVKLGGLPPFWTPPPFELSKIFIGAPEHRYVVPLGMAGTTLIGLPPPDADAATSRKVMAASAGTLRKGQT
jgi:hypothetical protein